MPKKRKMRGYTPFMYDLSKCINAFNCRVQLIRTGKKFLKRKKCSKGYPCNYIFVPLCNFICRMNS